MVCVCVWEWVWNWTHCNHVFDWQKTTMYVRLCALSGTSVFICIFFSIWLVPFQGFPQRITVFHFNLFSVSSTLTPTTCMTSPTASIYLVFLYITNIMKWILCFDSVFPIKTICILWISCVKATLSHIYSYFSEWVLEMVIKSKILN